LTAYLLLTPANCKEENSKNGKAQEFGDVKFFRDSVQNKDLLNAMDSAMWKKYSRLN